MPKKKPKTCAWVLRLFGLSELYNPDCKPIGFYSGKAYEWIFCHYCGRKIEVVK